MKGLLAQVRARGTTTPSGCRLLSRARVPKPVSSIKLPVKEGAQRTVNRGTIRIVLANEPYLRKNHSRLSCPMTCKREVEIYLERLEVLGALLPTQTLPRSRDFNF